MVITDRKLREAFRTDVEPYAETERALKEALDSAAPEKESIKMNTASVIDGKVSGRNGPKMMVGILAVAAVAVIAVILVKLIPALRSPLSADPGPEGSVPPAETLVTGETEDIDESEETDESSGNEHEATEDTGPVFETEYFTFTLPEIWRVPEVTVKRKADGANGELCVMYRGLTLCEFFVGQKEEFENPNGGDPSYYLAKSWDIEEDKCAALCLSNWAWVVCAQGFISPSIVSEAEYTSDEDLSDILYMVTGKVFDAAKVKGRFSDMDAADDVREVINASQDFINEEIIPAVTLIGDESAYTFRTEFFTFTLPEIWRSSPQNELPVSSVDVVVNDNELYVTYRGLTLCVIRAMQLNEVWQAYFEGLDDGRAVLWETNDDDGNTVLLTNPVALTLRDAGSPGWITSDFITSDYATSDTADAFTSDSDIVDILYILTGQEVDLERLRAGDEDADEYIQSVENAVRISFIMNVANQVSVPSRGGSGPDFKDYDPAALKSSCLTELLQAEPYSYEGLPESIEDCQIPEDVLRSLTNEELILTVLDYPYNEEITLPEGWPMTNQSWGDIRKITFNGFRELTEREEQSSILQRLNMCHDYIVREYGWEKPRDLLGYLEALIIYLDDSLDENSTIW